MIITAIYRSPVGELLLADCGGALVMCDWLASPKHGRNLRLLCRRLGLDTRPGTTPLLDSAATELDCWFAGCLTAPEVPLRPVGTPFQCRVWQQLFSIPYGSTVSYADVAAAIGSPGAVRAVANAVACNPLSIFVPCHRVTGSADPLAYAAGPSVKRHLLTLESQE